MLVKRTVLFISLVVLFTSMLASFSPQGLERAGAAGLTQGAEAPAKLSQKAANNQTEAISLASVALPIKVAIALLVGLIFLLAILPLFSVGYDELDGPQGNFH